MKIFFKALKYAFLSIPLLVIVIIIIRVITLRDPAESQVILNTAAIHTVYRDLGADFGSRFVVQRIRVRNPFALGDTFYVLDVLHLENSRDFQLTLRSKKNRFEELRDFLNPPAPAETFADLLKLYLRITTRVITERDGVREETFKREVLEVSDAYTFLFENNRYEYMRVNFSGVHIDHRMSRLDLFIFGSTRETDLDDLDNSGYLGRITLVDVYMTRQRMRMDSFERR